MADTPPSAPSGAGTGDVDPAAIPAVGGGFVDLIGLHLDELTPDRVTAHLDADERHHQPYGIVHGGVWATIVETLASIAAAIGVMDDGMIVVGVSNSTDFLRSHRSGRVEAVAEPIHVGRMQQIWQVTITRAEDGKPVARGQVRLQNLPADRDFGTGA